MRVEEEDEKRQVEEDNPETRGVVLHPHAEHRATIQ
jgi:hypothetical protein